MSVFIIHYISESTADQVVGGSKTLRGAIKKALEFDRQHYDDKDCRPDPTSEEIDQVISKGKSWNSSRMHIEGYIVGSYIVYEIELFD